MKNSKTPKHNWIKQTFEYETILSTNATAAQIFKKETTGGFVVVAKKQECGRGRVGRNWISPYGNIYLSVGIGKKDIQFSPDIYPLLFANITAEFLEDLGIEVFIKWPNDIVYKGSEYFDYCGSYKKISGILCETTFVSNEISFIVAGVGLNLSGRGLSKNIPHAGYVREKINISYKSAVTLFLKKIDSFLSKKWTPFQILEAYSKKCINIGCKVEFDWQGAKVRGTATGIDDKGRLIVESPQKIFTVFYGDVRILSKFVC